MKGSHTLFDKKYKYPQLLSYHLVLCALTKDEAIKILREKEDNHEDIELSMVQKGPKAYSTAGWLGLSDKEISETIKDMQAQGFDCFKMKVGQNLDYDKERLAFIRSIIGSESKLMLDCNQVWGVDQLKVSIMVSFQSLPRHPT